MKKIVFCLVLVLAGCLDTPRDTRSEFQIYQKDYEFGRRCFTNGVPAEANPYIHHLQQSKWWLTGWMDAKNERGL